MLEIGVKEKNHQEESTNENVVKGLHFLLQSIFLFILSVNGFQMFFYQSLFLSVPLLFKQIPTQGICDMFRCFYFSFDPITPISSQSN